MLVIDKLFPYPKIKTKLVIPVTFYYYLKHWLYFDFCWNIYIFGT